VWQYSASDWFTCETWLSKLSVLLKEAGTLQTVKYININSVTVLNPVENEGEEEILAASFVPWGIPLIFFFFHIRIFTNTFTAGSCILLKLRPQSKIRVWLSNNTVHSLILSAFF
jgi:hypothetical protein